MGELLNDCMGVVISIGLIFVIAWCIAPITALFGTTGRRRRRKRRREAISTREVICLILVALLLGISLANGMAEAMITSLLNK